MLNTYMCCITLTYFQAASPAGFRLSYKGNMVYNMYDRVLLISMLGGVGSVAFYNTPHEQTQ